jgi:hypothetical protein
MGVPQARNAHDFLVHKELMSEPKHIRDPRRIPEGGPVHVVPSPYWKRAHHDWRFWVGLICMFAAIAVYVITDDLALIPIRRPPPSGVRDVR